jgi:cytochrome-b5 reductase
VLFLQNKSVEDVIYKREWDSLRDQVKVVHVLSRGPSEWKGGRGYITAHLLREELAGVLDPSKALAFVCGPNAGTAKRPGFVTRYSGLLGEMGIAPARIITERG